MELSAVYTLFLGGEPPYIFISKVKLKKKVTLNASFLQGAEGVRWEKRDL